MAVSANTLFHFTRSEFLEKILLSQGIFAQYSDEHFEEIFPKESIFKFDYIPMISFCDLTIMQLTVDSKHRENFGEYGIGLTKEWGVRNRVSPVTYVHNNSQSTNQLHQFFRMLSGLNPEMKKEKFVSSIRRELIDSLKFFKPYEGRWHKGKHIGLRKPKIIYYHEREWRYCPKMDQYPVISAKLPVNAEKKSELNEMLREKPLKFKPSDVKFIVIRTNQEKNHFAKVIGKMKITPSQKNSLITSIISFEEIREDFG